MTCRQCGIHHDLGEGCDDYLVQLEHEVDELRLARDEAHGRAEQLEEAIREHRAFTANGSQHQTPEETEADRWLYEALSLPSPENNPETQAA